MKIIKLLKNHNIQSFLFGLLGGFTAFIIWGIHYTLTGSLAEWLSAIGTIGAVVVSLWLVQRKEKTKVEILISRYRKKIVNTGKDVYGAEHIIVVSAYNAGEKPISVNFRGIRPLGFEDHDHYIEEPFDLLAPIELEFILPDGRGKIHEFNETYLIELSKKYEEDGKIKLEVVFEDIYGKIYTANIDIEK